MGPRRGGLMRNRKRQVCFWPSQEAGEMRAYRRERWGLSARLHDLQTAPEPLGRTRPSLKKPSQTEKWRQSSGTPGLGLEGPGRHDDQGEVSFKTEQEVSPVRSQRVPRAGMVESKSRCSQKSQVCQPASHSLVFPECC